MSKTETKTIVINHETIVITKWATKDWYNTHAYGTSRRWVWKSEDGRMYVKARRRSYEPESVWEEVVFHTFGRYNLCVNENGVEPTLNRGYEVEEQTEVKSDETETTDEQVETTEVAEVTEEQVEETETTESAEEQGMYTKNGCEFEHLSAEQTHYVLETEFDPHIVSLTEMREVERMLGINKLSDSEGDMRRLMRIRNGVVDTLSTAQLEASLNDQTDLLMRYACNVSAITAVIDNAIWARTRRRAS